MIELSEEAKKRGLPIPDILPKEKSRLTDLAKKVAMNYSWILVCFIHQRKPQNDGPFFEVCQIY